MLQFDEAAPRVVHLANMDCQYSQHCANRWTAEEG